MKEGLAAVSEGMSVKHTLAHCGAISADTHRRFARDEVYQWGVEQYWYDGTVLWVALHLPQLSQGHLPAVS